jgi:hypothetical protein
MSDFMKNVIHNSLIIFGISLPFIFFGWLIYVDYERAMCYDAKVITQSFDHYYSPRKGCLLQKYSIGKWEPAETLLNAEK